jgi:hypothetical protein
MSLRLKNPRPRPHHRTGLNYSRFPIRRREERRKTWTVKCRHPALASLLENRHSSRVQRSSPFYIRPQQFDLLVLLYLRKLFLRILPPVLFPPAPPLPRDALSLSFDRTPRSAPDLPTPPPRDSLASPLANAGASRSDVHGLPVLESRQAKC